MLQDNWKRLDLNKWPEEANIYCNKCGLKNRGDKNWVYKDDLNDPDVNRVQLQIPRAQLYLSLMCSGRNLTELPKIAKNYYLCDDCRKLAGIKLRNRKIKENQNT